MQVKKEFEFESAHRLSNYEGKCKRIHGHNYKMIVLCEADELDERGILVDFGDIKKVAKEFIVEQFDHKLILKQGTTQNIKIAEAIEDDWIVWVDYNPTAENMAKHFLEIMRKHIPSVKSVEVFETPDSSAIAS